jgi:hypothetical protein
MSVFSEKDYNSNNGILTTIWGPPLWFSLHCISFNYPNNPTEKQKHEYKSYFISLKNILPCKTCRENYEKNLQILPIDDKVLKNRKSLSKWLYKMHELVNKSLGKESGLTYEDVKNRYETFRSRCLIDPKEKQKKEHEGCTEPLYGIKSKCALHIIPKNSKASTFKMDSKCILYKK